MAAIVHAGACPIQTQMPLRLNVNLLSFREQIQGPKNASIARFDGLCCYQKKSKFPSSHYWRPHLGCNSPNLARAPAALCHRVQVKFDGYRCIRCFPACQRGLLPPFL